MGTEESGIAYSLDELSARSGLDRRVIRSFIEQGLLRGANSMGRYAHYDESHLLRLLAIKKMRLSLGLSLAEIRSSLMTMTEDELRKLAFKVQEMPLETGPKNSALDFIKSIKSEGLEPLGLKNNPAEISFEVSSSQRGLTPVDLLLAELGKIHEQRNVRRQSKSECWYRIVITPDIELSVRGIEDPEQLANLERIADHLREILLGGAV